MNTAQKPSLRLELQQTQEPLTFDDLASANLERVGQFKNRAGNLAHSSKDGSDWTIAEWGCAVGGEAGEALNLAKKIRRGDFVHNLAEGQKRCAEELADVIIYADLMCQQLGLKLGDVVREVFNRKSEEIGVDIFI